MTGSMERRSRFYRNAIGEKFDSHLITEGILLQLCENSVSAIEFLKNRGVNGATIFRVLSGNPLRRADRWAIAEQRDLALA